MVATVSWKLDTGGTDGTPGTSTDIDALGPPSLRFKTADNPTIDAVNPVPIPTSGTNYSYVKSCYIYCDVAPDTQIDNFRFYSDPTGGFGTGITTKIGLQFPTRNSGSTAAYRVATGTPGTTGIVITTVYASITTTSDAFGYTSGSPLTGPTISEAGSIINAIGETTNYFCFQAEVISTASPGNKTDKILYVIYDEI